MRAGVRFGCVLKVAGVGTIWVSLAVWAGLTFGFAIGAMGDAMLNHPETTWALLLQIPILLLFVGCFLGVMFDPNQILRSLRTRRPKWRRKRG